MIVVGFECPRDMIMVGSSELQGVFGHLFVMRLRLSLSEFPPDRHGKSTEGKSHAQPASHQFWGGVVVPNPSSIATQEHRVGPWKAIMPHVP